MALPAGTVTLLFSDIEGSTRLLERLGEGYAAVLDEHRRIVREALAAHGGHEVRTEGDAFFVAFERAGDAVCAAVAAQCGLAAGEWPDDVAVRVRMGLHAGTPRVAGNDYVGMDVHRAARICSAAHGGQIVVSDATRRALSARAIRGVELRDLGEHRLKDLARPLRLYQVVAGGLSADFPPLRASAVVREERRLVTVLCAELEVDRSGVDPEQLRSLLAPRHARVRAELERRGGTIERFVGGAVLAVFGVPVAHEDDPERAVTAALRLLQLSGGESSELGPAVRVGVATGEALVTPGASSVGGEGLAQGQVVALALGLQRAAGAGTALADDVTARSTRRAIAYESVALGGGEEHGAWRAVRARERVHAEPAAAPFVGRDHELAVLERWHRTVIEERRPRLVAIVGEPGIGKTRLTNELIARIGPDGSFHRGRCLPYGEGITYWALREIICSAAGILLDDSAATAEAKLGRLVGRLIEDREDAEQTTAALARAAGIALGDSPLEGTGAESVAEAVGLAWPRFLGALVGERPAVVVVEDLHWAEPPLLDILERLVSRAAGPLLIVATARPEFAGTRPSWSSTAGMSQIGLGPLTEAQSRELVENLLPSVTAELRDRVAIPAEGNPFFAEEIVRHLIGDGASGVGSGSASTPIPNSVRALIASRIDALPDSEKQVLQDAAVIGRTFWASTLESMSDGADVSAALRALEGKGFVAASPTSVLGVELEYSFSHALKREVAYRSIPRARRARAHAAVATWIEEIAADRRGEFVDLIAYHYETAAGAEDAALAWPDQAAQRERVRAAAVGALVAAGEAATSRLALDAALRFADRAWALASADPERLRCLELRADALHAAVRSDEAFDAYMRALELAAQLRDSAAVARLRAHAALLCARYAGAFSDDTWRADAVDLVNRGLEEIGEHSMSFEAGALLLGRSVIASRSVDPSDGREEAAERDARRALEIAEAIDSPQLLSHAVDVLTGYASLTGFCHATEFGERLAQLAETLTSRPDAHEARIMAAICLSQAGCYERARELAREATREVIRMSPHRATHAAAAEAHCLAPAGRFEELIDVTPRVLDAVREEGGRLCQTGAVGLAGRALALYERGERAAATEALELFERAPSPRDAVDYWLAIDMLRPLAGAQRTRQTAARVHPAGTTLAGRVYELRLSLQLSALLGEWNILADLIPQARASASRACAPSLAYTADWAEAVRRAASGDGKQAISQATRAAHALERRGEPYTAARLLTDLLPLLDGDLRAPLAERTARRLDTMGASTSAQEAAAAAHPIAP